MAFRIVTSWPEPELVTTPVVRFLAASVISFRVTKGGGDVPEGRDELHAAMSNRPDGSGDAHSPARGDRIGSSQRCSCDSRSFHDSNSVVVDLSPRPIRIEPGTGRDAVGLFELDRGPSVEWPSAQPPKTRTSSGAGSASRVERSSTLREAPLGVVLPVANRLVSMAYRRTSDRSDPRAGSGTGLRPLGRVCQPDPSWCPGPRAPHTVTVRGGHLGPAPRGGRSGRRIRKAGSDELGPPKPLEPVPVRKLRSA